ncbi:heparan-alpha-glucosaminide N-acetyltransferase domain-containing protein [Flagellimonas flava]|uniref:heparan-alpha-glucosaminide N-acetyltransferase domain-containing protein n=1 Tax=Flagellimonas flava TaxID=570519 RepID=UPI003D648E94
MRLASIDILRAVTMVLMIWVNDFWTLSNVPKWLMHATGNEDYLGFSDVIFPLFLFIVGLSIPFAIRNRMDRGNSKSSIAVHILIRWFSLLLIGFYLMNYEVAFDEGILIGKDFWTILMTLAIVLVWVDWEKTSTPKKYHPHFRAVGAALLIFLAIIYKGGAAGEDWMQVHWWGILGLIGWAYLSNSLIFLYSKGNLIVILLLWILFNTLCILFQQGIVEGPDGFLRYFSVLYQGTIPAFTAAGVLTTLLFQKYSAARLNSAYLVLAFLGIVNIAIGLITRPLWGISKIQGTPSWLAICTGIGVLAFILFHYLADVKKKTKWATFISPAGTATLTCYMIPYMVYPIRSLLGFRLPDIFNNGYVGLLVSFVFALLVVAFTGWMERRGYKLKL